MPIDTRIDGNPADIQRVADWIRTITATAVDTATDTAERARRIADDHGLTVGGNGDARRHDPRPRL